MMIDMNDIQTEDHVKPIIQEVVNVWRNYKKRVPSRISPGVTLTTPERPGTYRSRAEVIEENSFAPFLPVDSRNKKRKKKKENIPHRKSFLHLRAFTLQLVE
jgi:hypothetical protein